MSKKVKISAVVLIVISLLASVNLFTLAAEIPYESYTYWDTSNERKSVGNRPMYETKKVIFSADIGVDDYDKINDVCTDVNGNIYILDNQSRITVIDKNYTLIREITEIESEQKNYSFAGARSLYVDTDSSIYICDTENQRVIHCDQSGKLSDLILLPDSHLIPDDFTYSPLKVIVDKYGYIYVLSDGSYYGALMYDQDKNFLGFYGANKVKGGILSSLQLIQRRMFSNSAKQSASSRKLPYCFVDIDIDSDGYLYTVTGYTENYDRVAQVKKLSPGSGANILESENVNFVDTKINKTYKLDGSLNQNLQGLAVDKDDFIYALDVTFGKVFMYDSDCNIVTVFGGGMGNGNQKGTFMTASAIALNGEDILVSDSQNNSVTVFGINDYGKEVKRLLKLTKQGNYTEAKTGWTEVLAQDNNLQLAYSGLAKVYFSEKNYSGAQEMAKKGYDKETYALAFEFTRKQFFSDHFAVIAVITLLFIVLLTTSILIIKKKQIKIIRNGNIHTMLSTLAHPALTFEDIKDKGTGSVGISVGILIVYYLATVSQSLFSGFLYSNYDPAKFNSLLVLLRSIGAVVLWVISNWLVCSLLGGRGKLREIVIVTSYSLMPIIISKIISTVFSNILLPSETVFISIISTVATIYAALLLIIGMLKIHDFSMSRFIGTTVLSVAGMAAIVFLVIMIMILIQQLCGFVATVFLELQM